MPNGIEEKVDLRETVVQLIELFQSIHSLTPEEAREQRELREKLQEFLDLGRELNPEEADVREGIHTRLGQLWALESSAEGRLLSPKQEDLWKEWTTRLLEIREREARRQEGKALDTDERVIDPESIAVNRGIGISIVRALKRGWWQ